MKYGRVLWQRPRDGQWIRGPTIPLNCAKEWAKHTTDNIVQRFEEVTDLTIDDYDTTTAYLDAVHSSIKMLNLNNELPVIELMKTINSLNLKLCQ